MQIEQKKVKSLREYGNNPRKNDNAIEAVARSIKTFGFKVPIIATAKGVVIAGHTRLKAAKLLGLETVPVITAEGLTDAQAKAYRLADNKTAELAEWDWEALQSELDDIGDALDMGDFGFKQVEAFEDNGTYTSSELDMADISGDWDGRCPHCGYEFTQSRGEEESEEESDAI